jgi:hypothetical protein
MKRGKIKLNNKEFAEWFSLLKEAAKEYRIGNLKMKDFEQYFCDGLTITESIEKFIYQP